MTKELQNRLEMARASVMRSVLRELNASSVDIEASACISSDGYNHAAVLGQGVDSDRFGAMCASLLGLAHRTAQEIQRGAMSQVQQESRHDLLGFQKISAETTQGSGNPQVGPNKLTAHKYLCLT